MKTQLLPTTICKLLFCYLLFFSTVNFAFSQTTLSENMIVSEEFNNKMENGEEVAVIIQYTGTSPANALAQLSTVTIKYVYEEVPFIALWGKKADILSIASMPSVQSVYEDFNYELSLADSHNNTQALLAQAAGKTGQGCGIAVLDTGIEPGHCMFNGKIPASACFSQPNPANGFSVCPNNQPTQISLTNGNAAATCTSVTNFCSHGTHVAGIAAGTACNGTLSGGGAHQSPGGVAPGATIIPVNIFYQDNGGGIFATLSDQMRGLEWVFQQRNNLNVCAVNMSLGGGLSNTHCMSPLEMIIDMLTATGIAVVIATGNSGSTTDVSFPACIESAIAVGAIDDATGMKANFSNHNNSLVDLMAPGVNITSAWPNQGAATDVFNTIGGTSMATPTVAGTYALLKAAYPGLSVAQLLQVLQETGAEVPGFTTPTIRIQDACMKLDLDFGPDLDISDPCNCNDNENCVNQEGRIAFFHDVLSIRPTGGAVALPNVTVTLLNNGGTGVFLRPNCSNPSELTTPAVLGTTDVNGNFDISFFHAPGATGTIEVMVGSVTRTFTIEGCTDSCPTISTATIPTMSEWGLSIFGLLILNLGVVFLRRKESILASY